MCLEISLEGTVNSSLSKELAEGGKFFLCYAPWGTPIWKGQGVHDTLWG